MVYADNAATTPLDKRVLEAMLPFLQDNYFNPSSAYRASIRVKSEISRGRAVIADTIGAKEQEITFTSGGTESDNLAIKGAAYAYKNKGRHIITTKIEHPAVLNTCRHLEKEGFEVTYADVNENGRVRALQIESLIRPDTILVSVMYVNNETGVIQPVEEIGAICKKHGVLFHTDAVQAYGHLPIDVNAINADMLSVSAHKIYGPKGTGFLYVRNGVSLENVLNGGEQESGLRPGTENVAGIMGLAKAAELMKAELPKRMEKEKSLGNLLYERISKEIPGIKANTDPEHRVPSIVNFSFEKIQGETLLINLDMKGIAASTGSACTQGNGELSHVLLAMGRSEAEAAASLRLSLGCMNSEEDIRYIADTLSNTIKYLRAI